MAKQKEIPTEREGRKEFIREHVIEGDSTLKEAAEVLGIHPITAGDLKRELEIPRGSVTARSEKELANKVARMRDKDNEGWHIIGIKIDRTKAEVKRLYTQATGKQPSGRAGRTESASTPSGGAAKSNGGGTKSKAKAKRAYVDMEKSEIKEALPGRTVSHKGTKYKVGSVESVGKKKDGTRVARIVLDDGEKVTLPLSELK